MPGASHFDDGSLIAFTHLPKAAGTTLHQSLRRTFGMRYTVVSKQQGLNRVFDDRDLAKLRRRYPRLAAFGGHSVRPFGPIIESGVPLRFITIVRDPVRRTASHYAHELRRGITELSFPDWIEDGNRHNRQCHAISGERNAAPAIELLETHFAFVGLQERFDDSMDRLRTVIPGFAPVPPSVRFNTSPREGVKEEVLADPDATAAIAEAQAEDLDLYRHVVDRMWPRWDPPDPPASGTAPRNPELKRRASLAKERLLLGIPRQLARRGITSGRTVI